MSNEKTTTNSKRKLTDAMIDYINNLFEMKTTQYASVIKHLENAREKQNLFENEPNPTVDQIAYRLKLFRSREVKPIVNLGELMGWCKDHSNVPDDPHEPFVLDYWHEKNSSGFKFGFVFTTLFLLNAFKSVDKICIDSTYKLNWDGFPLTILGTVDRNKTFHPIASACTTNETTRDYAFVFNAVKSKIKEFFSINFEPLILISDAADAIRNAFYQIFPNALIDIMCFAHVLRNIEKRPFKSKTNKKLIKDDIILLQQASDKKSFISMSKLFCAKWSPVESEFVAYFKSQWLGVHCNWFEGAAVYTPSTNNAQEEKAIYVGKDESFDRFEDHLYFNVDHSKFDRYLKLAVANDEHFVAVYITATKTNRNIVYKYILHMQLQYVKAHFRKIPLYNVNAPLRSLGDYVEKVNSNEFFAVLVALMHEAFDASEFSRYTQKMIQCKIIKKISGDVFMPYFGTVSKEVNNVLHTTAVCAHVKVRKFKIN